MTAETIDWHGCFRDSWKGVISRESFAHPAKFAYGLVSRIVSYGLQEGFWRVGGLLGDPFGGVALGGVMAAYGGLRWVGVELEEKFVGWGRANIKKHRRKWEALGCPVPTLLHGDSRNFAAVVGGCEAVITSPPYADMPPEKSSGSIDLQKQWETYRAAGGGSSLEKFIAVQQRHGEGYGRSAGQIGALPAGNVDAVVTSPPFSIEQPCQSQSLAKKDYYAFTRGRGTKLDQSMRSEDNIAKLKHGVVDAVLTSPPYENSMSQGNKPEGYDYTRYGGGGQLASGQKYGDAAGQIGREAGETYWQAMKAVYGQCLAAIRPGGVMAVNVKDYVRDKHRVSLCDQTARLLTHLGFDVFLCCRAMLVEVTEARNLFGEVVRTEKKKVSFFRRLAEKKGSPRIDWEEVLFCRRGHEDVP